ncbi:hypothetical protein EDB19DRAFT_1836572 [Suillus lakei]|nr:hypothetical protein EDB19DRAFT_1836572 [Suillus lakei]
MPKEAYGAHHSYTPSGPFGCKDKTRASVRRDDVCVDRWMRWDDVCVDRWMRWDVRGERLRASELSNNYEHIQIDGCNWNAERISRAEQGDAGFARAGRSGSTSRAGREPGAKEYREGFCRGKTGQLTPYRPRSKVEDKEELRQAWEEQVLMWQLRTGKEYPGRATVETESFRHAESRIPSFGLLLPARVPSHTQWRNSCLHRVSIVSVFGVRFTRRDWNGKIPERSGTCSFVVTGFGWIIVAGLILMPVVNEFNVLGPWLKLVKNIGLLVGAAFWGVLSDIWGRSWAFLGMTVGVGCNLPVDYAAFLGCVAPYCQLLLSHHCPPFSLLKIVQRRVTIFLIHHGVQNASWDEVEMNKQSWPSTKLQRTTNPTLEDLQMAGKLADAVVNDGAHMDTSALAAVWRKIFSNNHLCNILVGGWGYDKLPTNSFASLATQGAKFGDSSTNITYCNQVILSVIGVPGALMAGHFVELPYLSSYTSNVMYGVLYALSPELFPTKDRGTGNAIVATANRIFGVMLYSSTYHFISHQTSGRLGKLTRVLRVGNTSERGR